MSCYQSKVLKYKGLPSLRTKVEAGVKEERFGIITEIDIQATMKKSWIKIIRDIYF